MLDGVMGVADYQCRQILGGNYHRLAPVFSPPDMVIPFDGVKRIPDLVAFAEKVDISKTVEWLKTVWRVTKRRFAGCAPSTPERACSLAPARKASRLLRARARAGCPEDRAPVLPSVARRALRHFRGATGFAAYRHTDRKKEEKTRPDSDSEPPEAGAAGRRRPTAPPVAGSL